MSADAALALDPDSEGTHAVAGAQALIAGRVFKARNHLREALRQDPGDDDVAELFLEADRSARPPGLLFYYWSWVVHRVPGGRFGIWGAFVAFLAMHKSLGVPPLVATCVIFGYLGICLYTWIASPLTALWIRVFPTKY